MAFPQDARIALGMHATSPHGFYGLPVVPIFILLRVFNAVAWLTTVVRIALTVELLVGALEA